MTIQWTGFPAPQAAVSGDIIVGLLGGTTNQRFNATSWLFKANNLSDVASKTTAFSNLSPLTSNGDTLIYNSTNTRLGIGSTGQIYTVSGGLPAWVNNPGLLIANNLSDVANLGTTQTNLQIGFVTGAGTNSIISGTGSTAAGSYGFARGNTAISTNNGSVVWGDSNASPNVDTAANQFNLTFANGYRFFGGEFNVSTVGKGLAVKEGSNAKQGVVTLILGVGVVSNTAVTANSRIMFSPQDANTTGFLTITARTTGSGFTITSSVLSDTGVVAYEIFEPAV